MTANLLPIAEDIEWLRSEWLLEMPDSFVGATPISAPSISSNAGPDIAHEKIPKKYLDLTPPTIVFSEPQFRHRATLQRHRFNSPYPSRGYRLVKDHAAVDPLYPRIKKWMGNAIAP